MKLKKFFIVLYVLLILLFIYLLFFPRNGLDIKPIYNSASEKKSINFGNEITQIFTSKVNYLTRLDIYVGESLNSFKIILFDERDKIIFEKDYNNINNIINVEFPIINDSLNKNYKLSVTSNSDIIFDTQSNIDNNFIVDYNDDSLVITTVGFKANRSDLWYPLFAFSVLFTIQSLLEEKNEKEK